VVDLPVSQNLTVDAIYESYERGQGDSFRDHLGASLIGGPCERASWYTFRWATRVRHAGRLLRLFDTGNLAEARFVADLRKIGVTVMEVDPETGKQWKVRDEFGHFGGSCDGIGIGFPEAPKTWHAIEMKTHSAKSFKDLQSKGVQLSKPQHYAQLQCYLHLLSLTRGFYIAVNKDDDSLYQERINYDPEFAMRLMAKANRVVQSQHPPERISQSADWFQCKFCDHSQTCHNGQLPERNCRTCLFSSPVQGGQWHCNFHNTQLSSQMQRQGCNRQRFIPSLIKGQQIDAADDGKWVEYLMPDGSTWRDE
jgi:hypothetical protein